jgi:hypothetical protein
MGHDIDAQHQRRYATRQKGRERPEVDGLPKMENAIALQADRGDKHRLNSMKMVVLLHSQSLDFIGFTTGISLLILRLVANR